MAIIWMLCCLFGLAASTHFRGAIIQWRPVNPVQFDGRIEITHRIAWRRDRAGSGGNCDQATIDSFALLGSGELFCQIGCSGLVGTMDYHCTDFSETENWSAGERNYDYDASGVTYFEASFTGCCWISTLVIGADSSWEVRVKGSLSPRADTGMINTSPISAMPPIFRLQHGCDHTIEVPVEDVDGDDVRCRWAEGAMGECGEICRAFPAQLNKCTLQFDSNGALGLYGVALQIEDFASPTDSTPLSSVPLQFMVFVFNSTEPCGSKPEFVGATRMDGSCIGVPFDTTYHEPIIAQSGSESRSIIEILTVSPPGLVQSALARYDGPQQWYINVTWTPDESQSGPNIFCFSALDNIGLTSVQRCITLLGGVEAPLVVEDSLSPIGTILPNHTNWSLQFDKEFTRPLQSTYIRFYEESGEEVIAIDVNSSSVTYPADSLGREITFTTSYLFTLNSRYYVLLDSGVAVGTEFCGPESPAVRDPDFWALTISLCVPPCENGECTSAGECVCNPGWTGTLCNIAICSSSCVNGECTAPDVCTCDPGWTGTVCNLDIDECDSGNGGCSHNCTNIRGSYTCLCDEGYELLEDQQTCTDIDECLQGTHNCTVDGPAPACVNFPGGFRCSCDHLEGYRVNTSDYRSCEDIDECAMSNGGCHHNCTNTVGSFYCDCYSGYELDFDGFSCNDIDECENRTDNCSQGGEAPAECINLPGDFTCSCDHHTGYTLNTSDYASCKDIDECEEMISGCNQLCVNTIGSFECLCQNGYVLLNDNRTCEDIDECEVDNGGCEEMCMNTPGSYHCLCPRGFILQDDNRTCEARECPRLSDPLNGTITCRPPQQPVTTGGYCVFTCDEGFIHMGSTRRTCGPRSTWTGKNTFCEPKLCEKLLAPENGFVLLPCTRALGTSCTIDCERGYKIDGPTPYRQTCILDNELKWTDPPVCIVSNVCEPNPCEHNGICSPMGESDHSCDCEGTGYTGPTCTTGIVSIPPIPNLVQGIPVNVTVSAQPDMDLTISIVGGGNIDVSPTIIGIKAPATSKNFTISSDTPGLYSIRYRLFGSNEVNFNTPPDSPVFVTGVSGQGQANQYFNEVKSPVGVLKKGHCTAPSYAQCPVGNLTHLSFISGCQWSSKEGSDISPGVVFVARQDQLSLPLSISGIGISNSYDFTLPQPPGSCTPCAENMPLRPQRRCRNRPDFARCSYYPFTVTDIPDFLNTHALALTYLQEIKPLFPSWIQSVYVDLSTANPFADSFAAYEYNTDLVSEGDVSTVLGCENIETIDQGLYSVLRYARTISATIDGQALHYSDSSDPPVVGKPMCFAINLCQGASSPVYIELSPETHTVLVSEFLREYVDRGWEITIRSIALFETGLTTPKLGQYWNGIVFTIPEIPPTFDMTMNTESNAYFTSGHLRIKMDFSGKVHYSYKEQKGVIMGDMQMNINSTISSNNTALELTGHTSPATVDVSGTKDCNDGSEQLSGIALRLSYRQRPGQIFFSTLLSFSEETTECPVDAFMRMKNATDLLGLSLHTSCPYLNLGMLTFRGMVHRMYFSGTGSFESFCLSDNILSSLTNPSLIIQSSLQGDRLPLGDFLTLLPGSDSIALSVAYDRDDSTFVARLHSVRASILEADFVTFINVENSEMQLSATTEVFSAYSTNLTISAPINKAPWERLPLSVHGEMNDGPNSFVETLETSIHNELRRRADTANRRERSANMTRQRAQGQFMELERQFIDSQVAVTRANQTYEEALSQLDVANMKLIDAQRAFDDAGEEIEQLEENLDILCMERMCEDVCMSGPDPGPCYKETFVNKTGTCPKIDTRTVTIRVEPFCVTRRVWRWIYTCRDQSGGVRECSENNCETQPDETCSGKCVPVFECQPVFNWMQIPEPVQRFVSCTMEIYNSTVLTPCTGMVDCAVRRPESSCLEGNIACRAAKEAAFDQLEMARQDIVRPFRTLDEARTNVSLARSALIMAEIQLDNAKQRQQQIFPAYNSVTQANELAEANYELALAEIKPELDIRDLLLQHRVEDVVSISSVTFSILVVTESPTQIPLQITYTTPYNNQVFMIESVFDFQASQDLAFGELAKEIIDDITSSPTRKRSVNQQWWTRRQVPETTSNQQRFDENCATLLNIKTFFDEIATSLLEINASIGMAREITGVPSTDGQVESPAGTFDAVNFTVLETLFNVTANITSLEDRVANNEEINAYSAILSEYQDLTNELLKVVEATTFVEWQATLEILYNQSGSIGGHSCFSFGDCLVTATDILESLLEDTPTSDAQLLLGQLPSAQEDVQELATAMNLTISEAIDRITPIVAIIEEFSQNNYWCNGLPQITRDLPPEGNVSTNGTLSLWYEAESDLPLTYQWKRNGNNIPGATTNHLVIHNVRRFDSANYSCCASNPVGTVVSISTSVTVYELPEFYLTPVPTSVYEGADSGAWLACNATAWPYPGWRWYFRATEDDSWNLIEEEDTNELLIPDPLKEKEGLYTCEAFNAYGSIRADPVYLRVLPVTVSQQSIPIQFDIMSPTTCSDTELQSEVNDVLTRLIDSETTLVSGLEITSTSESETTISFSLISVNVTDEDINMTPLVEIANRALPTRTGLQRSKAAILSSIQQDEFTVECGGGSYNALPSSLIVGRVTYLCPPGQRLYPDFLLCVSCEPGSHTRYREQTRVFSGEALTERIPLCESCPIGSFEPSVGSSECMPCPEFYTTPSTGATTAQQCTVDPLQMDCTADETVEIVTIDCLANRPLDSVLCSFDDGVIHPCELPISISDQTFNVGDHTVNIVAMDSIGFTARDVVVYTLNKSRINFLPDVPPLGIHFTNNSPRIVGSTVEVDFVLTRSTSSVTCQVSRHQEKECSSGNVVFPDLEPGRYTLRVAAGNSKEDKAIERRRFEITADPSFCTVHLINNGVTVRDGGGATVEFAGTGLAESFSCQLDREKAFQCASPVELGGLRDGGHKLKIIPQGCGGNKRRLVVNFNI